MPCTELADAIVSSGRDTLLRAISLVNSHPAWGAKVVYGDTDSLMIDFGLPPAAGGSGALAREGRGEAQPDVHVVCDPNLS